MPDTPVPTLDPDLTALLAPLAPPATRGTAPAAGVRGRVLARVQASVAAHAEYRTVRREDGPWLPVAEGVRQRTLRTDADARVDIVALDAGTVLPWPEGIVAQEILLVEGDLRAADDPAGTAPAASPASMGYRHRVRWLAEPVELRAATPVRAYVRQLRVPLEALPPLEARWWTSGGSGWVDTTGRRWRRTGEGVEVLPLRGDAEVVSMLVRFAAGASVADHRHGLDEDCLVLEGEMFLGDILLRAGDYQLAPAGGGHFGECSDAGVLFFFHGALDPVLRGEARG